MLIAAILAAIAVPSFLKLMAIARESEGRQLVGEMLDRQVRFYHESDRFRDEAFSGINYEGEAVVKGDLVTVVAQGGGRLRSFCGEVRAEMRRVVQVGPERCGLEGR